MQLWRRKFLWLALSASWILLIFLGVFPLLRLAVPPRPQPGHPNGWPHWLDAPLLRSFFQLEELPEDAPQPPPASHGGSCSWGTCFDTSKCRGNGFKVFVYPATGQTSEVHHRILASLKASHYHTPSPSDACLLLLLPSLDSPAPACSLQPLHWNRGRNHLVLNLHPAPCPRASWLGQAMVAEASPMVDTFRPGFDVALPHLPEAHPLRGGVPGQLQQYSPHPGAALVALANEKGRWYMPGTHTSACPWNGHCEQDPGPEKTHPGDMLPNATFCLIPGHRPEASSFLQALQAGCIPVLLSPLWELPFSEVIDWTKAAILADKRLPLQAFFCFPSVLQVLAALQEMPRERVLTLRQQTQFLWDAYFSSVEKVIHTTLEIIQDRIFGTSARPSLLWNSPPGALLALPTFSMSPQDFPFYHLQRGSRPEGRFSALIWMGGPGHPPLKLIQAVAGSQHCAQIMVLWSGERPLPSQWPETTVPLTVIEGRRKVDFAFMVWQSFPERMVGFLTWSHFWDEARGGWGYTAEMTNEFSMVLTTAAFYHRYYHTLFTHTLSKPLRTLADEAPTCADVLMNFLVAAVTKLPPIKVPCSKQHQEGAPLSPGGTGPRPEPQSPPRDCINQMVAEFGYMPLVSSHLRLDPVLFKDPVSVQRKKYRSLEKPQGKGC
ncbi:exostosin-like 1 isoform X3 [Castor canadensis]|uniref:Exostosin-like 1 isoform X3 n=1 Tax=Castor canadensis TaxID=51338 RepID=A0AC58N622_CASCN